LKKLTEDIPESIKKSKIIGDNSPSVNFLLFLIFISYFIVGADLCKEIAKERNEIEIINGTLEESIDLDIDSTLDFLKIDPPLIGESPEKELLFLFDFIYLIPKERAPPQNFILILI
jgi:hypothetical protein